MNGGRTLSMVMFGRAAMERQLLGAVVGAQRCRRRWRHRQSCWVMRPTEDNMQFFVTDAIGLYFCELQDAPRKASTEAYSSSQK